MDSRHPDGGPDNRCLLESEIGDVTAALDILRRLRITSAANIKAAREDKLSRVGQYLHHIALP